MRTVVCARPMSPSFVSRPMFSSSRTCRCRARLPSVRAQSCFSSTKLRPLGCVISDVRTLNRARSWITRSSPSYAKRAAGTDLELLAFIDGCLLRIKIMNHSNESHTDPVRDGHGGWREGTVISDCQTTHTAHEEPRANDQHGPRQAATWS